MEELLETSRSEIILTFVRSDTLRLIRKKRVLTNDAVLHNIC